MLDPTRDPNRNSRPNVPSPPPSHDLLPPPRESQTRTRHPSLSLNPTVRTYINALLRSPPVAEPFARRHGDYAPGGCCCCRIETAAAPSAGGASARGGGQKQTWSKAHTGIHAGTISLRVRWCGGWGCGWMAWVFTDFLSLCEGKLVSALAGGVAGLLAMRYIWKGCSGLCARLL